MKGWGEKRLPEPSSHHEVWLRTVSGKNTFYSTNMYTIGEEGILRSVH